MAVLDAKSGGRTSREPSASIEGFDVQLRGASLADLIQLECSKGARAAVRVRSANREAHLFFDGGQIVHAVSGRLIGEEAVYEILNWTAGTFAESDEPWPSSPTVTSTWQQVLLVAAQLRDEQQPGFPGESSARLVAVRSAISSSPPSHRSGNLAPQPPRPTPLVTLGSSAPPRPSLFQRESGLEHVIGAARFDDAGNLLELRGDAKELVMLAAHLRRLADLIGESVGQDGFRAFECRSGGADLALFVDAPGSYVIVATTALRELKRFYRPLV